MSAPNTLTDEERAVVNNSARVHKITLVPLPLDEIDYETATKAEVDTALRESLILVAESRRALIESGITKPDIVLTCLEISGHQMEFIRTVAALHGLPR